MKDCIRCIHFKVGETCYYADKCEANFQPKENPILKNVVGVLEKQTEKGLKKYGTTVNINDYSIIGWIEHTQQELIDAVVYLETLKQKVKADE